MTQLVRQRAALTILGAVMGALTVLVGATAIRNGLAQESTPGPIQDITEAPPPGLPFLFLSSEGEFVAPLWDDRAMSEEARAVNPSINPAWGRFSICLRERGIEVDAGGDGAFTQADLDAVLVLVNREHPDRAANKAITQLGLEHAKGSARTYLDCAQEWLTKTPEEMFRITGEPNEWYPPRP